MSWKNTCERLVLLAAGIELDIADLPAQAGCLPCKQGDSPTAYDHVEWPPLPAEGLSLIELERRVIERVLEKGEWNVSQAARYLQVPRHILTYRMEKYGLRRPLD